MKSLRSQHCGELGPFAHGALGVQLFSLARTADVVEAIIRPAARLLASAYDDRVRRNHPDTSAAEFRQAYFKAPNELLEYELQAA